MIDHVCYASDEDLEQLDIVKGSQRIITLEEKDHILSTFRKHPEHLVGGSGTNVVKALRQLDVSCSMIGTIGNDAFADEIEELLQKQEVANHFTRLDLDNGQVICLITPDGERTFAVYDSSAYHTETIEFDNEIEETYFSYLSGYHLREEEVVEAFIKAAKPKSQHIVLDLASENVICDRQEWILSLLKNDVNIVFSNALEAERLLGTDAKTACMYLAELCEYAIVTNGKNGCYLAHKGEITHVPANHVDVVDTTGAGDVFSAGVLYGIKNGLSMKECGEIGTRLASEVIQIVGNEIPQEKWDVLIPRLLTRE